MIRSPLTKGLETDDGDCESIDGLWSGAGLSGAFADRSAVGIIPGSSFESSHWTELCSVPTTADELSNICILRKTCDVGNPRRSIRQSFCSAVGFRSRCLAGGRSRRAYVQLLRQSQSRSGTGGSCCGPSARTSIAWAGDGVQADPVRGESLCQQCR